MQRWILALVLGVIAAYCAFGFAATFEPMEDTNPWPWRIGYGVVGVVCFTAALTQVRRARG